VKIRVLVHPGSLFGSGKSLVDVETFERAVDGILEDVETADGLVVIDGFLSDLVPGDVERLIGDVLTRSAEAGRPAFRIWGCDAGEAPHRGWSSFGSPEAAVCDGQVEAARRIAPALREAEEIRVTGAWATRDGSSGCVNSVAEALAEALPACRVEVSPNALFEESMDEEPDP
jgi:hypothetical protein